MIIIYKYLIAEIKKQLALRGWKYADLSEATKIPIATINAFMAGVREGEHTANAIAKVLEIEI